MTPLEAYKLFLLKVNKNDTSANIKVPKSQFVLLFNEQKRKWTDAQVSLLESSDKIEDVAELLKTDEPLVKLSEDTRKADFQLPADFFKRVSSYSVASRGECKGNVLINWFVKPKDLNVLLQNDNQKPSFEYQETIALINGENVSIYKDGFTIDHAFLTYYREPQDIDIAGYKHIDGTLSTDQQTGLSKQIMELIIDQTATEAVRNYESPEQLQIALQREQAAKEK